MAELTHFVKRVHNPEEMEQVLDRAVNRGWDHTQTVTVSSEGTTAYFLLIFRKKVSDDE